MKPKVIKLLALSVLLLGGCASRDLTLGKGRYNAKQIFSSSEIADVVYKSYTSATTGDTVEELSVKKSSLNNEQAFISLMDTLNKAIEAYKTLPVK